MFWARRPTSAFSWATFSVRLSASALVAAELMRRPPRITAARVGTTIRARIRQRTRQLLRATREPERGAAARGASSTSPAGGGPGGPPGTVSVAVPPPWPSPGAGAPGAKVPFGPGPSAPSRSPVTGLLRTAFAPRTNRGPGYRLRSAITAVTATEAAVTEAGQHRNPSSRVFPSNGHRGPLTALFTARPTTSGRPRQL